MPEDHVYVIEPGGNCSGDEKLGIIGMRPGIGHRNHSDLIVFVQEILILEGVTVDAFSTGAISVSQISALDHEPLNDPMKFASFVVKILSADSLSFFPGAKAFKIFNCFRDIIKQLNYDSPPPNSINSDIDKNAVGILIVQI